MVATKEYKNSLLVKESNISHRKIASIALKIEVLKLFNTYYMETKVCVGSRTREDQEEKRSKFGEHLFWSSNPCVLPLDNQYMS